MDAIEQGLSASRCGSSTDSPVGRFVLVTGVGHCGTKWLARVLDRPQDGLLFYHEQKVKILQPRDYVRLLQYEYSSGVGPIFQPYFAFISSQLKKYKVVGDSNSWAMWMIPQVDRALPVYTIFYLVRNGIQNVHSMFYTHFHWPVNHWVYTHFLRRYWEITGRPFKSWSSFNVWEYWCFNWFLNLLMPSWLKSRLGESRVLVVRLEDVTSNEDLLLALMQRLDANIRFPAAALKDLQKMDINRKIPGDRSPAALWRKWSHAQREAFLAICGPTMERYGYEIPVGT